jgi:hypothetical protein
MDEEEDIVPVSYKKAVMVNKDKFSQNKGKARSNSY